MELIGYRGQRDSRSSSAVIGHYLCPGASPGEAAAVGCVAAGAGRGRLAGGCAGRSVVRDDPSPSALPSVDVPVPSDGVSLAAFGYTNGPGRRFALPARPRWSPGTRFGAETRQ